MKMDWNYIFKNTQKNYYGNFPWTISFDVSLLVLQEQFVYE